MKIALRAAIVGVMLHGGAHAAMQGAPVEPSSGNGAKALAVVQNEPAPDKRDNPARGREIEPAAKPPAAKGKDSQPEGAIERPADASQQTVELKGLRG